MNTLKVIKIGGKLIDDPTAIGSFLEDFAAIKEPKILIHGGGNLASSMARDLDVPVQQIDGRRITDDATLDIITMAYAGKINKNLVARLQGLGCNALGLTGADGNSIVSKIRDKKPIDFGHVGDPKSVNVDFIQLLLDHGITPVFCAITHDGAGQLLNTNADTVAADVCSAFAKAYTTQLYYCFEKQGVLRDINDPSSLIQDIDQKEYEHLKLEKVIADGMLPKMQNSFRALQNGVSSVHIGLASMITSTDNNHTTLIL
ncbi:acetylglutamate kinase [Nonlabens agnitus]|uniref:Acetylglutamate kinase n=1 Tax=Nonlabens agnitus TaxID=870484 RepID=A0A2S9WSJ2_9FLAO|nr:acetylglutamate kinase [Nonlabens agnitus]PRP66447.1 acetylglutamate kinase [Nonlabens agnitus]